MDTYSWALNCTIIDVINDIMWVPAVDAAAHRLGSSKNLLDSPCSGKTERFTTGRTLKNTLENSIPRRPQLSLPPFGARRLQPWGSQGGQQATLATSGGLVSRERARKHHSCCHVPFAILYYLHQKARGQLTQPAQGGSRGAQCPSGQPARGAPPPHQSCGVLPGIRPAPGSGTRCKQREGSATPALTRELSSQGSVPHLPRNVHYLIKADAATVLNCEGKQ